MVDSLPAVVFEGTSEKPVREWPYRVCRDDAKESKSGEFQSTERGVPVSNECGSPKLLAGKNFRQARAAQARTLSCFSGWKFKLRQ